MCIRDSDCLVVVAGSWRGDFLRQLRNANIEWRQFQVLVHASGRGVRRQTKLVAVDLGQLRLGFVPIDRVFGIEVVDSSPAVHTYLPKISRETLRPLCQKKDVGSKRLHQDAITN